MDLGTAQTHLDAWVAADLALSAGKSYSIANRQFTRNDADHVRNQMTYWQRVVESFQAPAGTVNPGFKIGVFR